MGWQPITSLVCGSIALLGLAGCGGGDDAVPATLPPIVTPVPTRFVVITEPSTTLVPVSADLVKDCVDYVQFGVSTGNGLAISMWDNAARDVVNLTVDCEYLGRRDIAALQELSRQWTEIETFLNGATTSSTPATGTPSTGTDP